MFACMSQEPEFVTELIKHVENINAEDNRKQTVSTFGDNNVQNYKHVFSRL